MKLVIAEKPSVAMALASVLGARTRKDGYVEGNGYIVSWCVGHLVGLCDASEYDEKYKKWRYEDLPIVPECWKHKILEGTKKQFGILKKLMRDSQVDEVICATDVDFLKTAHHGSRYSTGAEFLEIVRPELAVVSCSATNTYGHPSPDTLERLKKSGSRVLITRDCGAVTIVNGKSVSAFNRIK